MASSSGPITSLSIVQVAPEFRTVMSPLSPSVIPLPPPPPVAVIVSALDNPVPTPVATDLVVTAIPVPAMICRLSSPTAIRSS